MDPDANPTVTGGPDASPTGDAATDALSGVSLDPTTWSSVDAQGLGVKGLELATDYGFRVLGALLILLATWFLARWARQGAMAGLKRAGLEGALNQFLGTLVRWGIVLVGVMATLSLFGVETTSIAAILGGAGIGLGLAIQGNLANVAAGVVLLVVRPFEVGDWVEIAGEEGDVAGIGFFTTRIDTRDNRRVFLPNNKVLDAAIENRSFHERRRVDVPVGVTYDTDLRLATEVLTRALEAVEGRLEGRPVLVRLEGYGASSIDFKLGVWAASADYYSVRHEMIATAKEHLDEAGIGIPFPQIDLHLDAHVEEALQARLEAA